MSSAEEVTEEVPRDIIYNDPKIYASIKDFGSHQDDYCLVAEAEGRVKALCGSGSQMNMDMLM